MLSARSFPSVSSGRFFSLSRLRDLPRALGRALVLGLLLPLAAHAAAGDYDIDGVPTAAGNLQADIAALGGGHHVIELNTDVSVTGGLDIDGKNITFNLNGRKLEISNDAVSGAGLHVHGGGKVDYTPVPAGAGSFTVSSTGGNALAIEDDGSSCTLTGVQVNTSDGHAAILSADLTSVTVNGNVQALGAGDIGLIAGSGSKVTVNGNVSAADGDGMGAFANTVVTINGDILATGGSDRDAIYSDLGANVIVHGNVIAGGASRGVSAWENSTVLVTGDIATTNGAAIYADEAATVTVNGKVDASFTTTASGDVAGVMAYGGATVLIKKDVAVTSVVPDRYAGVAACGGGTVTIDGTLTAQAPYIKVNGVTKTPADAVPSTKANYENMYSNGTSIVWVTLRSPPDTAAAAPVPTLGPALLALLVPLLGIGVGVRLRRF